MLPAPCCRRRRWRQGSLPIKSLWIFHGSAICWSPGRRWEHKAIATRDQQRREIGLQLAVLARQMRNLFDRRVSVLGVTRSQWQLIAVVSRNPGATQRTIAEALEITEASAGRLVDRLVGDGLLERRAREDDRRAHAVYLMPAAEPLLSDLKAASDVLDIRMFRGFSDAEKEQLGDLLERAYANLSRE